MHLSHAGRTTLTDLEGAFRIAYRDIAGLLTIGVGHLLTHSELSSGKIWLPSLQRSVHWRQGLEAAEMDALLDADILPTEEAIDASVHVGLTQQQFDALVLFVFNIGRGAFQRSTLLTKLNAGAYMQVPAQLRRWVHSGGKVVHGLKRRREREVAIWERGEYV